MMTCLLDTFKYRSPSLHEEPNRGWLSKKVLIACVPIPALMDRASARKCVVIYVSLFIKNDIPSLVFNRCCKFYRGVSGAKNSLSDRGNRKQRTANFGLNIDELAEWNDEGIIETHLIQKLALDLEGLRKAHETTESAGSIAKLAFGVDLVNRVRAFA